MAKGRVKNITFDFAKWYWGFMNDTPADYESSEFRRYLGQAASLRREGYDLKRVRSTLLAMRLRGLSVTSPYAVKWQSPDRKSSWYEFTAPRVPALWDGLALHLYENDDMPARMT